MKPRNFIDEALKIKMKEGELFSDMLSKRVKEVYQKHGVSSEEMFCTEIGLLWGTFDALFQYINDAVKGVNNESK